MLHSPVHVKAHLLFALRWKAQFAEGNGACKKGSISTQKDSWYRNWL